MLKIQQEQFYNFIVNELQEMNNNQEKHFQELKD
jgi:hypothetical protein